MIRFLILRQILRQIIDQILRNHPVSLTGFVVDQAVKLRCPTALSPLSAYFPTKLNTIYLCVSKLSCEIHILIRLKLTMQFTDYWVIAGQGQCRALGASSLRCLAYVLEERF